MRKPINTKEIPKVESTTKRINIDLTHNNTNGFRMAPNSSKNSGNVQTVFKTQKPNNNIQVTNIIPNTFQLKNPIVKSQLLNLSEVKQTNLKPKNIPQQQKEIIYASLINPQDNRVNQKIKKEGIYISKEKQIVNNNNLNRNINTNNYQNVNDKSQLLPGTLTDSTKNIFYQNKPFHGVNLTTRNQSNETSIFKPASNNTHRREYDGTLNQRNLNDKSYFDKSFQNSSMRISVMQMREGSVEVHRSNSNMRFSVTNQTNNNYNNSNGEELIGIRKENYNAISVSKSPHRNNDFRFNQTNVNVHNNLDNYNKRLINNVLNSNENTFNYQQLEISTSNDLGITYLPESNMQSHRNDFQYGNNDYYGLETRYTYDSHISNTIKNLNVQKTTYCNTNSSYHDNFLREGNNTINENYSNNHTLENLSNIYSKNINEFGDKKIFHSSTSSKDIIKNDNYNNLDKNKPISYLNYTDKRIPEEYQNYNSNSFNKIPGNTIKSGFSGNGKIVIPNIPNIPRHDNSKSISKGVINLQEFQAKSKLQSESAKIEKPFKNVDSIKVSGVAKPNHKEETLTLTSSAENFIDLGRSNDSSALNKKIPNINAYTYTSRSKPKYIDCVESNTLKNNTSVSSLRVTNKLASKKDLTVYNETEANANYPNISYQIEIENDNGGKINLKNLNKDYRVKLLEYINLFHSNSDKFYLLIFLQRFIIKRLYWKRIIDQNHKIITIQKVFRGYLLRKMFKSTSTNLIPPAKLYFALASIQYSQNTIFKKIFIKKLLKIRKVGLTIKQKIQKERELKLDAVKTYSKGLSIMKGAYKLLIVINTKSMFIFRNVLVKLSNISSSIFSHKEKSKQILLKILDKKKAKEDLILTKFFMKLQYYSKKSFGLNEKNEIVDNEIQVQCNKVELVNNETNKINHNLRSKKPANNTLPQGIKKIEIKNNQNLNNSDHNLDNSSDLSIKFNEEKLSVEALNAYSIVKEVLQESNLPKSFIKDQNSISNTYNFIINNDCLAKKYSEKELQLILAQRFISRNEISNHHYSILSNITKNNLKIDSNTEISFYSIEKAKNYLVNNKIELTITPTYPSKFIIEKLEVSENSNNLSITCDVVDYHKKRNINQVSINKVELYSILNYSALKFSNDKVSIENLSCFSLNSNISYIIKIKNSQNEVCSNELNFSLNGDLKSSFKQDNLVYEQNYNLYLENSIKLNPNSSSLQLINEINIEILEERDKSFRTGQFDEISNNNMNNLFDCNSILQTPKKRKFSKDINFKNEENSVYYRLNKETNNLDISQITNKSALRSNNYKLSLKQPVKKQNISANKIPYKNNLNQKQSLLVYSYIKNKEYQEKSNSDNKVINDLDKTTILKDLSTLNKDIALRTLVANLILKKEFFELEKLECYFSLWRNMVYLDKKKSLKNLLLRFKEKARLSKSTLLTDNLRKYSCPITNDNNDYTYLVEKHSNVSSLIYNINPSFNKNHEEENKNENDLDDKILVNKCHKKNKTIGNIDDKNDYFTESILKKSNTATKKYSRSRNFDKNSLEKTYDSKNPADVKVSLFSFDNVNNEASRNKLTSNIDNVKLPCYNSFKEKGHVRFKNLNENNNDKIIIENQNEIKPKQNEDEKDCISLITVKRSDKEKVNEEDTSLINNLQIKLSRNNNISLMSKENVYFNSNASSFKIQEKKKKSPKESIKDLFSNYALKIITKLMKLLILKRIILKVATNIFFVSSDYRFSGYSGISRNVSKLIVFDDDIDDLYLSYVLFIQQCFRNFMTQKHVLKYSLKLKKLNIIKLKLRVHDKIQLKKRFIVWKRNVLLKKIKENVGVIQNFYINKKNIKYSYSRLYAKSLLRLMFVDAIIYSHLKPTFKQFNKQYLSIKGINN